MKEPAAVREGLMAHKDFTEMLANVCVPDRSVSSHFQFGFRIISVSAFLSLLRKQGQKWA